MELSNSLNYFRHNHYNHDENMINHFGKTVIDIVTEQTSSDTRTQFYKTIAVMTEAAAHFVYLSLIHI